MNLPKHNCGLYLSHNEHKDYYESAETWLRNSEPRFAWKTPEARKRAIATDSIWVLQWYPLTPVGFLCVAAPTLDELLEFAQEVESA